MRYVLINLRGDKTQEEVAKALLITQKHLSAIERGNRNPSIDLMKRFERYFNKSIIEIFPDIFLNNDTTDGGNKTIA